MGMAGADVAPATNRGHGCCHAPWHRFHGIVRSCTDLNLSLEYLVVPPQQLGAWKSCEAEELRLREEARDIGGGKLEKESE